MAEKVKHVSESVDLVEETNGDVMVVRSRPRSRGRGLAALAMAEAMAPQGMGITSLIYAAAEKRRKAAWDKDNARLIKCCKERRLGKPSCPDYEGVCATTRECDVALDSLKAKEGEKK